MGCGQARPRALTAPDIHVPDFLRIAENGRDTSTAISPKPPGLLQCGCVAGARSVEGLRGGALRIAPFAVSDAGPGGCCRDVRSCALGG